MNNILLILFLMCYTFSFSQEQNTFDPNNLENKLFPFKFLAKSKGNLIINLRHYPLDGDPQMITVEFFNSKMFIVAYYWTTSYYDCASKEEILKNPDFYKDSEIFTDEQCPSFGKEILNIYDEIVPKEFNLDSALLIHADFLQILVDSNYGRIYIERFLTDKTLKEKVYKILKKALKCIQKKYVNKD